MSVYFYHEGTGVFTGRVFHGPAKAIELNTPPGCRAYVSDDSVDTLSHRIDLETGKLVDYKPPAPSDTEFETWRWDDEMRRWVAEPTTAAHWRRVRAERDRLLRDSDWVVIAATERTDRPSREWLDYRQALRDITTQPDPLNITWPEVPK